MTQLHKDLTEPCLPTWHPCSQNAWIHAADRYIDAADHYMHVLPAGSDLFYEKDIATGYLRIIVQNQNGAVVAGTPFMPQRRAFAVTDQLVRREHRNIPLETVAVVREDLVRLGHPVAPSIASWGPTQPDRWERFARRYLGLFR